MECLIVYYVSIDPLFDTVVEAINRWSLQQSTPGRSIRFTRYLLKVKSTRSMNFIKQSDCRKEAGGLCDLEVNRRIGIG